MEILLHYDTQKKYQVIDIFYDLNLSVKQANLHLERLAKLGFIEFLEDMRSFHLTEKAEFLKFGVGKSKGSIKETKINKILETLFYFSNLNKEKRNV